MARSASKNWKLYFVSMGNGDPGRRPMHIGSFATKKAAEDAAPAKLAAAGPRTTLAIELRYMGNIIREWRPGWMEKLSRSSLAASCKEEN